MYCDQGEFVNELYYRYDLESFFYTLVWILTYHIDSFSVAVGEWSRWYNAPTAIIANSKAGMFYRNSDQYAGWSLEGTVAPETRKPLCARTTHSADETRLQTRRLWVAIVTYQKFMAVLDPDWLSK